ncbi:hypothetical protein BTHERMOSOX_1003 [Bathymodiolus thermophilus thioautotrophic gill symbiont]|uniref:Prepilin-type N-terminal cleavage/methylation domain-containing protein n=1 Tax=Bathymodiolus thermophilus thioautotrophic gill symbiont TaxID=2360 RepID=A0A1J5UBJ3_9GAMM|nr:prepilin-type N-terminal cleavage/methylation domain-containing protein [Bathymodiolus thermophilus thioautotrophic gill symbiont]OIR25753.1 hypothetical protein BGC33_15375 [Bathymodiolus thermophilus thioautotrophic gill symbiont]CAB5495701.1 hypothetical protein THERMOS_346 [Bathymodiolus thermophilus thioautotrophic gill symbiont]SHA28602.1 hypothetical protein BTHERMOSOX_1003 [Bathymodiolus thermophilus thioautotrophic gill symbiont]
MKDEKTMKQRGFSLIELVIVIAIIAVLSVVVLFSGSQMFSEGTRRGVLIDTTVAIPAAINLCSKIHRGDLSGCNKESLMRKVPTLDEKTACGDLWSIAPADDQVVLTYPLTSCEDRKDIGEDIVEYVLELPRISKPSTAYTNSDFTIRITYLKK